LSNQRLKSFLDDDRQATTMTAAPRPVQHVDAASKFVAELTAVRNNCKVFSELLTEMKPGQETAADVELLEVKFSACYSYQLANRCT
jgi:hypothetical protein